MRICVCAAHISPLRDWAVLLLSTALILSIVGLPGQVGAYYLSTGNGFPPQLNSMLASAKSTHMPNYETTSLPHYAVPYNAPIYYLPSHVSHLPYFQPPPSDRYRSMRVRNCALRVSVSSSSASSTLRWAVITSRYEA